MSFFSHEILQKLKSLNNSSIQREDKKIWAKMNINNIKNEAK